MQFKPEDIFTPQGRLEEVEQNPNLDFLMNIFNIPRAFGVSGFGPGWNVGQHCYATALIALFWAKLNRFEPADRDRLTVLALTHDLHESVTGDILPMFKAKEIRPILDRIQTHILEALGTDEDEKLKVDLKICDMTAFIYEIKQVSPNIMNAKKLKLATTIAEKQTQLLFDYGAEKGIDEGKIHQFLTLLEI